MSSKFGLLVEASLVSDFAAKLRSHWSESSELGLVFFDTPS